MLLGLLDGERSPQRRQLAADEEANLLPWRVLVVDDTAWVLRLFCSFMLLMVRFEMSYVFLEEGSIFQGFSARCRP